MVEEDKDKYRYLSPMDRLKRLAREREFRRGK